MIDKEKLIKALEHCSSMDDNKCFRCPYSCQCEEGDFDIIKADALTLLKEQGAKIDAQAEEIRQLHLQLDEAMLWR